MDIYGLEVWDGAGKSMLKVYDRLTAYVATEQLDLSFRGSGTKSKEFTFNIPSNYVGSNIPWAFSLGYFNAIYNSERSIKIETTSTTIKFTVSYISTTKGSSSLSVKVMYGVY